MPLKSCIKGLSSNRPAAIFQCKVTVQVDRLKAFRLLYIVWRGTMRDYQNSERLGYFEGYDISDRESRIMKTAKVPGALIRSMRR